MSVRQWIFVICAAAVLVAAQPARSQPVGSEFQVNTVTVSNQWYPSIAFGPDGGFVVVWGTYINPLANEVRGQRYSSTGAKLGTEFPVNGYTTDTQHKPVVAAEDNGDFVVLWQSNAQDNTGYGYGIFGRRFASNGAAIGGEFQVNTYTYYSQFDPVVASDSDGDFVVVWQSNFQGQDGDALGLFGRRFASNGGAIGGEFQVNITTIGSQNLPAIASDDDGNFVVAWTSPGDSGIYYGIVGRRFASSGAALSGEFQVNTHTQQIQFAPNVSAENNGDFVVVWVSYAQESNTSGVFGQRFASGGGAVGTEFQINSYTPGYQRLAEVASDKNGAFAVVWESQSQDGSSYGIFGRRYASDGVPAGVEFQVNSHTDLRQQRPAIASSAEGALVVAWWSEYQDSGPQRGVFAQRFAAPPPCPAAPDGGCTTGFGKGLLVVNEKSAGNEKVIAKLLKGPTTTQTDLGNPLGPGGTRYNLCIYGDSSLVADIEVDRAGSLACTGVACWGDIGGAPPSGKGYKYKDTGLGENGVAKMQLKSGTTKILLKGAGSGLPVPIAPALSTAAAVTMQLRGSDMSQCFGVTLSDFKKQESNFVKVK